MESDLGKLFIGGISWDTDEDRLKEYFGSYGEVAEAVIMRDRTTGRARGFGFVVFTDPTVAEKVVTEKHMIDGRTVEAKKAVPRDDHNMINRNSSASIHGSPNLTRTKKIFVGGLASTVTESDFKTYFDQFGTITDVVVMYDHNTQRPRGFGFITYDSEESVDKVFLHSTFHELNGKMVEVKRAVPKELSPSPARTPLVGPNYSFSRANSFLNSFSTQGYNMNGVGNYGLRMDNRFSPVGSNRAEFSPFGSPGFGMGMNLEPGLTQDFGGGSNFGNNPGYGRVLNPYMNTNSNRYITPIGYSGGSGGRSNSFLSSPNRNSWGGGGGSGLNISTNSASANVGSYLGSGSGNYGFFGNNGGNWGPSVISGQAGGGSSSGGNIVYGGGGGGVENSYGLGGGGIGRSVGPVGVNTMTSSFSAPSGIGGYEGSYGDLYRGRGGGGGGGSTYGGDPTWQSASSEIDDSDSFGYGLGNVGDVSLKVSEGYVGNYSIADRQSNRGIAA